MIKSTDVDWKSKDVPSPRDTCCKDIFIPSEGMWGSDFPVGGEPVLRWGCNSDITTCSNYMFLRCSQTTTRNAYVIPTSAATSLSAPSTYWQRGASLRGMGRGAQPQGEEEERGGGERERDESKRRRGQRGRGVATLAYCNATWWCLRWWIRTPAVVFIAARCHRVLDSPGCQRSGRNI